MKVKFIFAWYDFWMGLFWDRQRKWLYIFPLPMLGMVLKFGDCFDIQFPRDPEFKEGEVITSGRGIDVVVIEVRKLKKRRR